MHTEISIDKAGRIIVPKALRDALGLSAGDKLELKSANGGFFITPQVAPLRRKKKKGVLVFSRAGASMNKEDFRKIMHDTRERRDLYP